MIAIFKIENHTITYQVNWLGIETIHLNNRQISKKLSLGRRVHSFELLIDDASEIIHLESKQSFSGGNVTVSLFKNGEFIDSKVISFYNHIPTPKDDTQTTDNQNTMFIIGLMLIVLSLCFDWSKFFLFIGLIFLFDAVSKTETQLKTSESKDDIELKD